MQVRVLDEKRAHLETGAVDSTALVHFVRVVLLHGLVQIRQKTPVVE